MPSFAWQAVDAVGTRKRGKLEAASSRAATLALESSGLLVVDVAIAQEGTTQLRRKHKNAVLELTRALSALLAAGMPLARALAATRHAVPEPLPAILEEVRREVERGTSLSLALAAHPELFNPLYTGVIRAAEKSGDLAAGFNELSQTLERQHELREKLISLSIYPILLAAVGGAAVIVLITVVMPRFVTLLQGTGAEMPAATSLLLAISDAAGKYGIVILTTLLIIGIATFSWLSTPGGREAFARVLLSLPLVGPLRSHVLAGRFARLSAVLITNGAAVLNALADAAASMADPIASKEVERVRSEVREGSTLHAALGRGSLFPRLLPQLVAVGEESGKLPLFLVRAADIFERGAQRKLERLVALLEPAMIVMFGGIVAFVALALLQAIYGLNSGALR
jgi:type II secretory pathway component PulF